MRERDGTPKKTVKRRAILAAAGAIGAASALPGVSASEWTKNYEDDCLDDDLHHTECPDPHPDPEYDGHKEDARPCTHLETMGCCERLHDDIKCRSGSNPWATGYVEAMACEDCERGFQLHLETSLGVSRDPCVEPTRHSITDYVEPGEKMTIWFEGHIRSMHTSSSTARITVNQNDCTLSRDD
jgi:hypothetical protein